jgi:hypothetical protein
MQHSATRITKDEINTLILQATDKDFSTRQLHNLPPKKSQSVDK